MNKLFNRLGANLEGTHSRGVAVNSSWTTVGVAQSHQLSSLFSAFVFCMSFFAEKSKKLLNLQEESDDEFG